MPIGLILTIGLIALGTALALIPRRGGKITYFLTVVVNEIPHVVAAYVLVVMTLAWFQDDLEGATGTILVALTAATLAGHVELTRRAMTAGSSVDSALGRGGIEHAPAAGRVLRPLMAPFPLRPWGVTRTRNISYGSHRRQRLDVYGPRHRQAVGPVLVYLHGGGYNSGRKHHEARALLHHFASQSWLCISADYRLRPGAGFEDHLADARAVVTWAHTHAHEHGGDASTLAMAGSSAGGHLTALCALTQHSQPDPGTSRIDAAVGLYGYYGRYYGRGPDEWPISSALDLDATKSPPFFLVSGGRDSWVPPDLAPAFARQLRSQSRNAVVHAGLPNAQHGFDLFYSWRFAAVIGGLDAFLATVQDPRTRGASAGHVADQKT